MRSLKIILSFLFASAVMANEDSTLSNPMYEDEEFAYRPGAQVLNAIIADLWSVIGQNLLTKMRSNPKLIDPYLLKLKGGRLRYAPTIRNIELISPTVSPDELNDKNLTASLPPPRFACGIVYRGTPDLEFVLTGADGYTKTAKVVKKAPGVLKRLIRALVPDIGLQIKSIYLRARLEVEIDMRKKRLEFFFVKTPIVEWDLEFSLTKAHIPMVGENSLDTVLTNILGGIDKDHPINIKF
mmetsp:Transcript_42244/g.61921  ORF Transcript_42244/g.61921 Transcript_42244/m.61921 type:complete len:240 (-) Transcript_42244:60-779(-)|eukprot:CAMPEP_0195510096 /NCGR_PEP_ID=MMETSP0794_2-20130614/2851_1 /TAXON_ID=515487 /ORGANISM="Stephanopyxis turris, Strain CCMP 815" /LENGTH=239 /DNA_ID=CAMNT_0040637461 /DNA_START=101 /DNA_END=820 /DNA_ORIENTATION=+